MVDIDFKQYRMLKIADKKEIFSQNLSQEESDVCCFLCDQGFLISNDDYQFSPDGKVDLTGLCPVSYRTSQAGKAQICAFELAFHKWWISVVIAFASFIVSLIALLH